MSVTGTQIVTRLEGIIPNHALFNDSYLYAINAAIDEAWPSIKNVKVDSSNTIASTTYEYTTAATDLTEYGYANAYATTTGAPKDLLRRVAQRRNGETWTVILPSDVASFWNGQTLHLQYVARPAQISALTETIYLPTDFVWKAAAYFLFLNAINRANQNDTKPYELLATQYEKMMQQSKLNNRGGDIPHTIPVLAEQGLIERRRHTEGNYSL